MNTYQRSIESILAGTGISINGTAPQDIQVHNENFYKRVLQHGSLGLGESYMEGWWDCEALDDFFARVLKDDLQDKIKGNFSLLIHGLKAKLINQQTKSRSAKFVPRHYNVGNDLYIPMLDSYMMYSCGYWENANTLEEAQENKLKLICKKLKLEPGMKVLDIGCGWDRFAYYASKNHQVEVTGLTLSTAQAEIARQKCQDLRVEIKLQDYRDHEGQYDRVLSIGMFEHIGYKNHGTYMKAVNKLLKNDGISLLHSIGNNKSYTSTDPWIDRYIFPNSLIPSIAQIGAAMEPYFIMVDFHNFGKYYDLTLMAWLKKFKEAWPKIGSNYNEIFYRMWVYYLSSCAGSFRVRKNNLWQIIMIKSCFQGEYNSVRTLD